MTSHEDPQAAWVGAWMNAQREGWQRFFGAPAQAAVPPGPQAFVDMLGTAPPASAAEVSRKLMDFGESYLGIAGEFWKVIEKTRAAPPSDESALRAELDRLRTTFTQGFARLYGAAPAGGDVLAAWQNLGAGMWGGAQPTGMPGLPAFGFTRERQEAAQRTGQAALRCQKAFQRFSELQARIAGEALDRLSKVLASRAAGTEAPDSLRAVYDLWIDSGERAYAAAAHGAEFAAAQAELNDALTDLKLEQQKVVEDWARALDLPTRSEINTILKRVNTLRRRVRELEEEVEQLRARR